MAVGQKEKTMGFFAQNATVSGNGGTFETAEPGSYFCRLKSVEVKQGPSFDNPDVMENRFMWVFETTDASDSEGRPFRFSYFTSIKFGNDKSKLTILLDSILGRRLSTEEFQALDLEELKAIDLRLMVDEKLNSKGYMNNVVLSVKPVAARTQPAQGRQTLGGMSAQASRAQAPVQRRQLVQEEDLSDLEDPFAEEADTRNSRQIQPPMRTAA